MVNVDEAIIAKYEHSGEHFEILVDPDLAAEFRNPDGQDVAIEDLLAVEEIFKDSKKGDKASEEAMNKVFETTDPIEVSKIILEKGTVQLTADQKRQMQADKRKLVINKIAKEAINPQNGLPHPVQRIENACDEAKVRFDPFISVDQQTQTALKAIKPLIPIKFEKAKVAVVADYRGFSVEEITELRRALQAIEADFTVTKNTLCKVATKGSSYEAIADVMQGPTAIAFGFKDEVSAAKVLSKFIKENKKGEITGAVLEGKLLDAKEAQKLASMPGREELYAKMLGSINSPASGIVYSINGVMAALTRAIAAVRDTKQA